MMPKLPILLLALAGCAPCSDGFMIVTVQFSGYTADADHVDIDTQAGTQRFFHPRGEPTQPYEVPASPFVQVTALRNAQPIATASKDVTLIEGCPQVTLNLAFGETTVPVENGVKNKADILFVLDDSASTSHLKSALKGSFPLLVKILDDFGRDNPAHYHMGVVTSDMGSGPFTLGGGQCYPGGRGGRLQNVGAAAPPGCMGPTEGFNFLDYNQSTQSANLPVGQDLAGTFACMSTLGDRGCGFEQPLEAAYRALHDIPQENHDFLRPDAQLHVLFLMDEDDCSADPQSDIFDPAKTDVYGPLLSYRCTQFGVACDGKLPPYGASGSLMNCAGATEEQGGKLIGVKKYVDFFRNPLSKGGVKANPDDVFLATISPPSYPFSTTVVNLNPVPPGPPTPCSPPDGKNCAVVLQHSCISPQNTQFFGDPAVRLNQVVASMPVGHSHLTPLCEVNYHAAIQSFAQRIVWGIGTSCVTRPLPDPANPDCTVIDEATQTPLPRCGTPPCWRLEPSTKCSPVCASDGAPGQRFEIKIDRGGAPIPATSPSVRCTTVNVDPNYRFSPDRQPACAP
jgi:hypothetical protein